MNKLIEVVEHHYKQKESEVGKTFVYGSWIKTLF